MAVDSATTRSEQSVNQDEDSEQSTWRDKSSRCCSVNKSLIPFKAYYMFFFSGLGSFVPYESLYFKQLWFNPSQAGFLIGVKPFCHFCAASLWSSLADKLNKRKSVLLFAVLIWSLTNLLLGFLPPAGERPEVCHPGRSDIAKHEEYTYVEVQNVSSASSNETVLESYKTHQRLLDRAKKSSNITEEQTVKIIHKVHIIEIPSKSKDNRKTAWVPNTFILAFFILAVGHLVAAPTQTLSNTATLVVLGNDIDQFGFQRCFGAFGWGAGSFLTGVLLIFSHSESLKCPGYHEEGTDFRPCLFASSTLIFASFICVIFFKSKEFEDEPSNEDVWLKLQLAISSRIVLVILLALYCGAMKGAIEAFLLWHLQLMGASQILIALVTLVNALGEMCGFLAAQFLIELIGHIRVMYTVLIAYSIRFLCFYLFTNPWYVLAIEWIKGLTFSVFWTACISYLGLIPGATATLQSLLHGAYWGLGYSLGPTVTGLLVAQMDTGPTFLAFAFFTMLVLGIFAALNMVDFGKMQSLETFLQQGYGRIDKSENEMAHQDNESDFDF